MSLFTWGLGVLSVILLGLIVLFSNKKVIAETKLEQADETATAKDNNIKIARQNADTINKLSSIERAKLREKWTRKP